VNSIVDERDRERVRLSVMQMLEDPEEHPFQEEYRVMRPLDGETIWIQGTALPLKGPEGAVERVIGSARDITERKRAEKQLRESVERFRVLFDRSPVSLWEEDLSVIKRELDGLIKNGVTDLNAYLLRHPDKLVELVQTMRIVDVNQATLELFEARDKAHLQENIGLVLGAESLDMLREALVSLSRGVFEFTSEGRNVTLSGRPLYVQVRMIVPDAYRHDWSRLLVSVVDLTERRSMEEELRTSEARFRELFNLSPIPLKLEDFSGVREAIAELVSTGVDDPIRYLSSHPDCLKELAGRVRTVDANRAMKLFIGLDPDAEGAEFPSLPEIFTERSWKDFLGQVRMLWEGTGAFESEGEARTQNGELRHLLLRMIVSDKHRDNWSEVLVSIVDITDRIRAEQERLKLEAHLRQSQKLETVGTLAGGIAHDFNNILTPILGYAEMAKTRIPEGQKALDYVERIEKAATRAKSLVQQILLFSRRAEQERQPVPLGLLAKEALKLLRASIPSTIEIRSHLTVEGTTVLADPNQLHQVVANLCTNAWQAMEETGGLLEVSVARCRVSDLPVSCRRPFQGQDIVAALSVRDTGCGMTAETREKIFEPFYTTKPAGKGTGLGMSVVHGVVSAHGGAVFIDSEPGAGTCVTVYLPVTAEDVLHDDTTDELLASSAETAVILLADDEPEVLDLHREVLESVGYEVMAATDGEKAWHQFKSNRDRIRAVVTDLTMPGCTGLDLARRVQEEKPGTPVVLVSGYKDHLTAGQRTEAGISAILSKPVPVAELARMVGTVLTESLTRKPESEKSNQKE